MAGVCQALVGAEVPLAVGWAASIADDLATNFARKFYETLKFGQPLDRALCLARQEAWTACKERGDPSWTLPVLYSATSQSLIFDPDPQRLREEAPRKNIIVKAFPDMKEGYAEHFVGRRREQQRLLPALKSGYIDILIITGLGGSGKSTLATRLGRELETYGFIPIPVSSSEENQLNTQRLLLSFGDTFRQLARKDRNKNASKADELSALATDLNNPQLPEESRLHDAVAALNEGSFLLLLDNFESNLDLADFHIRDPEISKFYRYLLENLSGGSRAIITTRYPPSDVPDLPPKARREDLSDFSQSSFFKILQRDPEVERRIRSGALPILLLTKLYQTFGGTPRFLLQIREDLKSMDAKDMKAELEQVKLPDSASAGQLEKIRDKYFQDIIAEDLYSYLSTAESQKALCCTAVFSVPVILEGFSVVSSVPQESISNLAGEWADRAFAYRNPERPIWTVYGLLRPWLLSKLTAEERKKAHRAAGDFLMKIVQEDRLAEISLSWTDCLMEARSQYLQAGAQDLARDITVRLSDFLIRSGFYDTVRHLNSELLQYDKHPSPMSWIARSYFNQGDYHSAQRWYQRYLDACSGSNDLRDKAVALVGLGSIDLQKGDYHAAQENFEKALRITQQIGDLIIEASIRHQLAMIDFRKGDYQAARKKFENSITLSQQNGFQKLEADGWHALATIDSEEGHYELAQKKFKKSLKITQQIGDLVGEAVTWHGLASVYLRKDDYEAAHKNFEKSLKITQQIGDREGEAATFHQLGVLSHDIGRTLEGLRLVALSFLINESIGHEKAKFSFRNLSRLASQLKYTQKSIDAMLKEVAESYARDRGWSLIRAAFPEA